MSSRKLWRQPLFPWENRAFAFSTTSTTGSWSLSLRTSCANTGTWCSCTSASWAFGSTGKRANSPRRRGSLFLVWNWIRSIRQHASRRNVLSRCWTAWMRSRAGPRSHWNNFRGSWGIWQLRRQWRRWGCFIWDRFNTGSMAESRGGRGNAALTGSKSHRPAAKPSPRGQTFRFSGQECPWNRSLGMLWFSRMPPPPAGAPRSTGLQCRGFWRGPQLHWHISCLELLAVHLALNRPKRRLQGKHLLVRTDTLWPLHTSTDKVVYASVACCNSPATSSYGVRSIWGRFVPFTFRACSTGQPTSCHELRSPESGDSIPRRPSLLRDFSLPVVYSLTEETLGTECTGTQLAAGPPQVCVPPQWAFSHRHCARSGRTRSRSCSWRRTGPLGLDSQNWCSSWQPLLGRFLWGRIYWLRDGAPYGTRVQTSGNLKCLVPGRDAEVLGDLPQEVVDTITSARALSTRHAYALKWNLFVEWCSSHREDPRKCPIRVMLSFLQQGLERRLSPFTLKVYVAAIAANHDPVEGKSVGKHDLVIRFLRGAGRLNPPRPPSIPSWDLSLVLRALQQGPFGPLQTVELKFLSDSAPACIGLHQEGRGPARIFGRRFVPRVWAGPGNPEAPAWLCAQGSHYSLLGPGGKPASAALGGGRPSLSFACPVRALKCYVDRTQSFRTSDQLFICHGGRQKGMPSPSRGWPTGWWTPSPWLTRHRVCPARSGWEPTLLEVLQLPGRWLVVPRWQIIIELRVGRPLTRSLDSIAFVWNRSPPVFSPQTGRSTERLRFRVGLLKLLQRVRTVDPVELLRPLGSQTWRSVWRQALTRWICENR